MVRAEEKFRRQAETGSALRCPQEFDPEAGVVFMSKAKSYGICLRATRPFIGGDGTVIDNGSTWMHFDGYRYNCTDEDVFKLAKAAWLKAYGPDGRKRAPQWGILAPEVVAPVPHVPVTSGVMATGRRK